MIRRFWNRRLGRRSFLKESAAASLLLSFPWRQTAAAPPPSHLYWVKNIPKNPFTSPSRPNEHAGVNGLLTLMGEHGLKFYRSDRVGALSGPSGLIAAKDVVLIKVNAQWKYRGCTNSDVIRGLIQRILRHPDGFTGEVVLFGNGQGWGSLDCDSNPSNYYGDTTQHANANDESHSFLNLVDRVFRDSRVSAFLMDPFIANIIAWNDHTTNGFRTWEDVSYPCFTTAGGRRVELRQGIWTGTTHSQNLKLINVPVLKDHPDMFLTCSLKHTYGILSMNDGVSWMTRHSLDPGQFWGKMMVSIKTPVLNIVDAIWVSHGSLMGYPPKQTTRVNQLLASQDPVALDYWAAKYILHPIDNNAQHHPDFPLVNTWLTSARDLINDRGGLYDPDNAIYVRDVTKNEASMLVRTLNLAYRSVPPIIELLLQD